MRIKNCSILITGAMGQDGKILSKILLKHNYLVYGWIRNKKYSNKFNNVKYSIVNLLNKKDILCKIKKIKPKVVVHLGSSNPSFDQKKNSEKFNKINTQSAINLINSIVESNINCTFIFSNSSQIFLNKSVKKKVDENDSVYSNDSYTKFRIKVLNYLEYLKETKNFKYINLLLFNHDSILRNKKFLIPRLVNAFKKKNLKFIEYIFTQNIMGDFSHAEDICYAIELLIKKKIETNNLILSSGKITKINNVIRYLCKITNLNISDKLKIKKNPKFIIGNNLKAKRLLQWKQKKNIYDVIDEYFN
jgi:GDP-D-mannose dehydratase